MIMGTLFLEFVSQNAMLWLNGRLGGLLVYQQIPHHPLLTKSLKRRESALDQTAHLYLVQICVQ